MGQYAAIIIGEIEGVKVGLGTDIDLWHYVRDFEYEKFEGEWLIGFGVGFNKGQNIRDALRKNVPADIFSEGIHAIFLLLEKERYATFHSLISLYIKQVDCWKLTDLPDFVVINVRMLLEKDKLQQALNVIIDYYKNKYVLIGLSEFEKISIKLKTIRKLKQKKQITATFYQEDKNQIVQELDRWIEEHAVK